MEAALYWLCLPIAQVGGLSWPLATIVSLLVPALLAIQGGIFGAFVWCTRTRGFFQLAILAALAWYLLELTFALGIGFPWLPLSGALVQWPYLVQLASVCGSYLLGALWLLTALFFLNPVLKPEGVLKSSVISCLGFALAALMVWHGLRALENVNQSESAEETAAALMIEGNIEQNQKWTPPFQKESLDTYIRLTDLGIAAASAADESRPLLIWPETAMPFFYENSPFLRAELEAAVKQWGCPVLFGAPAMQEGEGEERVFNRAFLLGPSGQMLGSYDKMHLVPFGEYLPKWLKLDFLAALLQGVGIYEAGKSGDSLNYGKLALGVLICYEAIFPWLARDRVQNGANILVDISNDGWFGSTPAARQHLYLSILRCVEQNRWLWRATNTGISAVADNHSQILAAGPQFREGYLLCQAKLATEKSVFYYIDKWLPLCACILFGLLFWFSGKKLRTGI